MSAACQHLDGGAVELYFYEEMSEPTRESMSAHLRQCRDCATALDELKIIRAALASRPNVFAPPAEDWSAFMARLDAAVAEDQPRVPALVPSRSLPSAGPVRSYIGLLATAALVAIVTMSVLYVARNGGGPQSPQSNDPIVTSSDERMSGAAAPNEVSGMHAVGEQHFERSKLVVLGLSAKAPAGVDVADWAYERALAGSLLNDTRLYRLAAEQRGLTSLAGVMRDLELVLLETAMAQGSDPAELPQIQRLIRKRQLIQKMDVVTTAGLRP